MSGFDVRWYAGESRLRSRIENGLAESFSATTPLHASAHRTLHRAVLHDTTSRTDLPEEVVIKTHLSATGPRPVRERMKRLVGWSPAKREWHALRALFDAGVSVPRPWAWGRLPNGDEIVVADFIDGQPIQEARMEIARALARAIARLHEAGYRHGDLHLGNLLVVDREVVLLDLQRARRLRSTDDRFWDLARLELSLARAGWNPAERNALRDRLGAGDASDASGRIFRRFLRDHLRGRARRVLRLGRNWSVAQVGSLRGVRETSLPAESLTAIIESSKRRECGPKRRGGRVQLAEAQLTKLDGGDQFVLVKRTEAGTLRRALGDRLRGSPAARAFRAGQASHLLSARAARPLAFLEERRFGLPINSSLVLEKVGDGDLDRLLTSSPEVEFEVGCALAQWLADGHAWGLSHRDLKANNIRVTIGSGAIQFWMIDLEDLRGPRELSDESRLHALTQLNASLEDGAMSIASRLAALEIYEARVPFSPGMESPATIIARQSLARAHRWKDVTQACRAPTSG